MQTSHTHPSTRAGSVARGQGLCATPFGEAQLLPGTIFYIPSGCIHRFETHLESMDVIAYHPDSDFGPTHEEPPMINKTLVDGAKIDNSSGLHLDGQVIRGRELL